MTSDSPGDTDSAPKVPAHMLSRLSNRKFFWTCTAAVIGLSMLPYLIGFGLTPKGSSFYGNRVVAPADYSIYYSYIEQGRRGQLFMYDAFTSEAHQATLIQPLWFILGGISRLLHVGSPLIFALARWFAIPVLMYTLWWAARWLWPENASRQRTALLLSVCAGGLGGLTTLLINLFGNFGLWVFPDMWVTEAYTFSTFWGSPHFILVTSGIVYVLVTVEQSWIERRWALTFRAGAVTILLASIHPFHVVTWVLAWLGLTLWRTIQVRRIPWDYVVRWTAVLVMGVPIFLLYGLQLLFDPITIGRAVQNVNVTSTPWVTAVGLGGLLVGAVIGVQLWRPRDQRFQFVVMLSAAYLLAIYLPLPFQRRLSQGMSIPLSWLLVPAFGVAVDWLRRRLSGSRRTASVILLALLSSTWMVVFLVTINDYLKETVRPRQLYFLDREIQQVADVLRNTDAHQPVLATALEGNVLAGLTAHQVYVGYGVETLDFDRKVKNMSAFFGTMTAPEQRTLLRNERLCYILTSPRSATYGSAFQAAQWNDLRLLWSGPTRTLYQTPYCR